MRVTSTLIAATLLLFFGGLASCGGREYDDDDSAIGDDDSAIGDDDTTGGPQDLGSVDVTGAPACGTIGSAWRIVNVDGFTTLTGIFASTAPLTCPRYNAWDDAVASADAVFQPAYDAAVADRDPLAACNAMTTYYSTLQGVVDDLSPVGSCSLQLRPDDYLPGDYEIDAGHPEGMSGKLVYPTASYYGAALDSLGDCGQYSGWDGIWTVAQADAAAAAEATRDTWDITAGVMDIVVGEDNSLTVQAEGMTLQQTAGGATGTLDFQVHYQECQL